MLKKETCLYQPFYCEENIWQLCKHEAFSNFRAKVVFLLPSQKYIAVWQQKLSEMHQPVLWDYHVIFMVELDHKEWWVYDFDTQLPFPIKAKDYFTVSFSSDYPDYLPVLKVIDSKEYVKQFHSDRSHMIDQNGNWLAPPPAWEKILNKKGVALTKLLNLNYEAVGKCYSLESFKKEFFAE
ncbi:MAG: hypothetical protein AAGI07_05525 [Bacteroidota bacterium]